MTDDEIREACARARGWQYDETLPDRYGRWKKPFDDPRVPISTAWIPMTEPPPLDGNTAMALLDRLTATAADGVSVKSSNNAVIWHRETSDGGEIGGRIEGVSSRNVILGCLLALGEISAEDVAD